MRAGAVAFGVVLLVLGAVLLYVPLVPSTSSFQSTYALSCSSGTSCVNYTVFDASPSLFGGTSAKLSWTSSGPIEFGAVTCSGQITTSDLKSDNSSPLKARCGTQTTVATAQTPASSGSYTFSIPSSGTLIFYAASESTPGPTVNVTLTYTEPIVGALLLFLGLLVLVVGLVLRSKKAKPAPSTAPPAWNAGSPSGAPAPPGSSPPP